MKDWTRRSLIVGGAALALPVVGLGAGKVWCRVRGRRSTDLSLFLLGVYPASAAARAVGEKYLEQSGTTASAALRRIEQDDRIVRAAETGCRTATLAAVEQACCDDFRSGRTCRLDGWVLARTELDIAALAST